MNINDNETAPCEAESNAHGRAALLLVESLIHGLCESAVLSPRTAVEIAERAANVQLSQAIEGADVTGSMWRSHALLCSISASLKIDDVSDPSLSSPED